MGGGGGVELQPRPFLTSVLGGCELLADRPSRFTSGQRTNDAHCIGG